MNAIVAFTIALTLVVLFLAFKVWEHKRKKKVFHKARKKADAFVKSTHENIHTSLSEKYHQLSFRKAAKESVGRTARVVATTAQKIELGAHHLADRVSATNGERRETKSSFLKEVTNHKESLDTESVKRDTRL